MCAPRDPEASGLTDWVQLKIFLHIYTHYPNVKKEWDKATPVRNRPDDETKEDRWFRDAVLGTRGGLDRVSANPNNSPRIERFWPALHNASKRDAVEDLNAAQITSWSRIECSSTPS